MPTDCTPAPSERDYLERVRALALRGDLATAEAAARNGLAACPHSPDLQRALAGIYVQMQRHDEAETLLSALLMQQPGDAAAAFALARLLKQAGRMAAAAATLRACFAQRTNETEMAIQAIELLDDCGRKSDAAAIAEDAIAAAPDDPRLHAYAGMLEIQIGQFERAREHYLFALQHSTQACEWHVPHGLASAQRYTDANHPDFVTFRECLQRKDLSPKARSTLLFALAKACDDVGAYAQASAYLHEANALGHALTAWSRKHWRRATQARLASAPLPQRREATADFIPVFIVGMPRSGTTLTASLLARHPDVCNRGELPWLARLAQSPELAGTPGQTTLERLAAEYAAQARQDDSNARWFIDKQPLNFRYVGLILALWPRARIVHCQRNARDTALSLWTQSFLEDVQGYAFDFEDIAVVMRDEQRLMAHWRKAHDESIRSVNYEQLASDPERVIAQLSAWLEIPAPDRDFARAKPPESISTASLWQARQPVYTRSIGRWRNYAPYIPELLKFSDA